MEYSRKSKRCVGDSSGQWSWWVRRCGTRERREGRGFGGDPRPAGRTSRSLLWVEGSRTGLGASRTKPLPRPVLGWESPGGGSVGPTVNPEALAPAPRRQVPSWRGPEPGQQAPSQPPPRARVAQGRVPTCVERLLPAAQGQLTRGRLVGGPQPPLLQVAVPPGQPD